MTAETLLGIGVEPKDYTVLQVSVRTVVIFFASLVIDGKVLDTNIAKYDLTQDDLREDIRLQGLPADFRKVREARIERSGEISVIPAKEF